MKVSRKTWDEYIGRLKRIDRTAADRMIAYMNKLPSAMSQDIDALIEYAYGISIKYGEAAAELACEMYDTVAASTGKRIDPAIPAETAEYGEVAKAVRGTAKTGNRDLVAGSIERLVKRAGVDTTMQNALRDGAEWAWIPNGDTCAFCLTLASRGWQQASRKALKGGHAEHIHANCDCTYAIRFNQNTDYAGYDPEKYKAMYYSAKGKTPDEKINAMRRAQYARNKDAINAQKREAYAKRTIIQNRPENERDFMKQFNTFDPASRTNEEKLAQVNPHYRESREYSINCQRCVVAQEAIERGYDVTAKPWANDRIKSNGLAAWKIDKNNPWSDPEFRRVYKKSDFKSDIKECFEKWGDGSRAIVRVQWTQKAGKGNGHFFTARREGDKIIYTDPQIGKARDIDDTLRRCTIAKNSLWIMRVDNREFSDAVVDAIQNRE